MTVRDNFCCSCHWRVWGCLADAAGIVVWHGFRRDLDFRGISFGLEVGEGLVVAKGRKEKCRGVHGLLPCPTLHEITCFFPFFFSCGF